MTLAKTALLAVIPLLALPLAVNAKVREACRADIQTHCASADQNKRALGACLRENQSTLTEGCTSALSAAKERRKSGVRAACRADVQTHCASVERNRKAIGACLKENQSQLSQACSTAFEKAQSKRSSD
ncbi:MAG: hypothetical protein AAGC79_10410 [Pseudomonadota bacterium]